MAEETELKPGISRELYELKLSGIQNKVPPNYFINGFLDARRKYEASDKRMNELEFIIQEMEKIPDEYNKDIKEVAEKINSRL